MHEEGEQRKSHAAQIVLTLQYHCRSVPQANLHAATFSTHTDGRASNAKPAPITHVNSWYIILFLLMATWLCSLQEEGNVSRLALQKQVGTLQACLDKATAGQKGAEDRLASMTQQMQVCYISVCCLSYHPCFLACWRCVLVRLPMCEPTITMQWVVWNLTW